MFTYRKIYSCAVFIVLVGFSLWLLTNGHQTRAVTPTPTPGGNFIISGYVMSVSGNPVSGARLTESTCNPRNELSVLTDTSGRYSLSLIDSCPSYTITVKAAGYQDVVETHSYMEWWNNRPHLFILFTILTPTNTPTPGGNFTLSGMVTDSALTLIVGARVSESTCNPRNALSVLTDARGSYTLPMIDNCPNYTITVQATGYQTYTETHSYIEWWTNRVRNFILFPAGTPTPTATPGGNFMIFGRVMDSLQNPIVGARISESTCNPRNGLSTLTDASGAYMLWLIDNCPTYTITVQAAGYQTYSETHSYMEWWANRVRDFILKP